LKSNDSSIPAGDTPRYDLLVVYDRKLGRHYGSSVTLAKKTAVVIRSSPLEFDGGYSDAGAADQRERLGPETAAAIKDRYPSPQRDVIPN